MHSDVLQVRVGEHQWLHTIDLRQGVVTPRADGNSAKFAYIHLLASLDGRSLLADHRGPDGMALHTH